MRTNRSNAIVARRGSIPLLLLTVLLQACSSSRNPLDTVDPPAVPQPPSVPAPPAERVPAGALEVSVAASDAALTLGYMILVYFEGIPAPMAVRGTGALTRINLPQGSHSVVLQSLVGNCAAEDPEPRPFSIVGGETTRIGFTVSCPAVFGFAAGTYERITSHYPSTEEFHGTLSERYVIEDDSSFGLRGESGRFGSFEYRGALYLVSSGAEETRLGLVFAANRGRWTATATLRGKCLVVEYNTDMSFSDFEHGEYCRQ